MNSKYLKSVADAHIQGTLGHLTVIEDGDSTYFHIRHKLGFSCYRLVENKRGLIDFIACSVPDSYALHRYNDPDCSCLPENRKSPERVQ